MFLHGATSGYGRLNAMSKPIVMVAELPFKNYDGTYPWNVNGQGVNNADRVGMFPHKTRQSVALTDGSALSLSPIQDGIFRQAGQYLEHTLSLFPRLCDAIDTNTPRCAAIG